MNTKYLIIVFCISVCVAYWGGTRIGDTKCKMKFAQDSVIIAENQTKQVLQNKRIVHDKVYKTGVADIRRILQSKYTIAE